MNNSNFSTSQPLNTSTSDGNAIRVDYLFPFEKLEVWQLAKKLCISVYGISKKFPSNELYGLTSQINRAAISVASNLAEGSSRTSQKDQAHFSQLAYSSLMEVACQLSIVQELGFVDNEKYAEIRREIEGLSRKINALHRSQKKRATGGKGQNG
jgi:four helix bundle protein